MNLLRWVLLLALVAAAEPTNRPKIEDLRSNRLATGQLRNIDGKRWEAHKKAMVAFLAEMETFYPDKQIYFLGRDADYIHDLARVLHRKRPEMLARIHLLEVSRAGAESPNVGNYLEQEKVGAEPSVLIDTGFLDTIPSLVIPALGAKAGKVAWHYVLSGNPQVPQSRVYFEKLHPVHGQVDFNSEELNAMSDEFENLPKYHGSVLGYELKDGRWTPIATPGHDDTETSQALKLMADLNAVGRDKKVLKEYEELRGLMQQALRLAQGPQTEGSQKAFTEALAKLSALGVTGFIADLKDASQKKNLQVHPDFWAKTGTALIPKRLKVGTAGEFEARKIAHDRKIDVWKARIEHWLTANIKRDFDPLQSNAPAIDYAASRLVEMAEGAEEQRVGELLQSLPPPTLRALLKKMSPALDFGTFTEVVGYAYDSYNEDAVRVFLSSVRCRKALKKLGYKLDPGL